ncbi:hypothetical protein Moror_16721 [Moniliophthora roreri MCA 2997]|uniref:Pro-pol protein n=1 Tax=Moniliophthora roreri (strain MCA 2997) TaxID=1381753 RepID=V2XPD3_MONRO|nr:hypothetical protein Moror_16721 [Moniliophthora roreri MCA 2997]
MIEGRQMKEMFLISGLGPEQIILGLPWLQDHNPDINWVTGVVKFRPKQKVLVQFRGVLDKAKDEEVVIQSFIKRREDTDEIRINTKLSASQTLAQTHKTKVKLLEELIPTYLSDYMNHFKKKKAERFPLSCPYNHAIDLKLDFKLMDCKIYPLSPKEWIEQDKFINENLQKGYI